MVIAPPPDPGASVAVQYKALPKESKLYLEKVLQDWLGWHRRSFLSEVASTFSIPVVSGTLEFTPSLLLSVNNVVSLAWVDKPSRSISPSSKHSKLGFNLSYEMVGDVPKYDCGSEQPLDAQDAERRAAERLDGSSATKYVAAAPRRSRPRCFNCGSYYHPLKDCLMTKDNEAISRARSEHQDRGNPGSASGRYFLQASAAGKEFSDLQPGVLSEELRAAMGLRPEDPPPWLFRMRQLGYPPGYRRQCQEESDDEVIIIGDDDLKQKTSSEAPGSHRSNGDASDADELVAFPGLNAPLPANADPAIWFGQPTEPLVNGMTPEERGFKRSRFSGSNGAGDSAEHAAKRARFWDSHSGTLTEAEAALHRLQALAQPNQDTSYMSSAPQQQAAQPAYGPAPSYPSYRPTYPYPPVLQSPFLQQPQGHSSQQWPTPYPHTPQPAQQPPFAYNTPPAMHPGYAPPPGHPQATPHNGVPPPQFHQLHNGFPGGGQLPGGFPPGPFCGEVAFSDLPAQPFPYQHPENFPAPQQQQQQQQLEYYNHMQWRGQGMDLQSAVGEPPLPPPPPWAPE